MAIEIDDSQLEAMIRLLALRLGVSDEEAVHIAVSDELEEKKFESSH